MHAQGGGAQVAVTAEWNTAPPPAGRYVCMYVCMHVCMHACIYVIRMYVCMYIRMYIHITF